MEKDKISKKLLHIEVKDNGLILSQKVGNELYKTKSNLENTIVNDLIVGSNATSLIRYKIAQNNQLRDFKIETHKVINETKKSVKTALKSDTTVNLTDTQVNQMSKKIDKGLLFLEKSAVNTYQKTLNNVFQKVHSAGELKEQLQQHINSGVKVGVVYQDGKEFKFDSYWEMKTRTDIQNEIANNMLAAGHAGGVIFYIAAFFGDCAKDHVDFQGKIYYDKDWRDNAPKDRVDEIEEYINSKCEMSVQDVMTEKGNFLTTRPNCRHYFQYVDIDSVLGAKSEKDVSNLRDKMDLNFNGKYRPEKYEALLKQRTNERKIRAKKEEVAKLENLAHLNPKDKTIQSRIKSDEALIKKYQHHQVKLVNKYNNLQRSYERESINIRGDFNGGKTPTPLIVNNSDNDRLIGRKHIGMGKKSFDEVSKLSQQMLNKKNNNDKMEIELRSDPRLFYENCQVREYYHKELAKIPNSIPKNLTLEEQAMFAFTARNNARLDARSKMVDVKALSLLPVNTDFEAMVKYKMEDKSLNREEALKDIIRTSTKSNGIIDRLFKEDA